MLARADLEIAAHYDALAPEELRPFSAELRAEYQRACSQLLEIRGTRELLDFEPTMADSQVESLKRELAGAHAIIEFPLQ